MKKNFILPVALFLSGALPGSRVAFGQRATIGNWSSAGNDAGHSGWQKAETKISKESAAKEFKFLWKIKLDQTTKDTHSFTEPLLALRLINAQGFKDLVLWGGTNTVYAVDSELGTLVWKKSFDVPAASATGVCGARNLGIILEAPQVINFGARRAPGAPPPPPPAPPSAASERRLGVPAGGGGFGLKGIYVLTGDGYLHEQVLTTGVDYAPAVKFLPTPNANPGGLSISGKTVFTMTGHGCGVQNAVWAIDIASHDYPVSSYAMQKVSPLGLAGPTIGDGVAYVVTGSGTADPSAGVYANSVVSLTEKELKVKDWYTPSGDGKLQDVTPVAFTFKQKKLVAAPGKDGSFVLLDNESLGGADHHTPLAQTASVSKTKGDSRNSMASWQDSSGQVWVLASVSGPVDTNAKFETINGPAPHGSIVAFKVDEKDGQPVLTPSWVSRDLASPASPVIANGVVIALSEGDAKTHAKLYVLDAATGKELYSSGDAITTYAHLTGVSVGDGHAFFTTHDGTLYSFGIAIEH
jgi:hypothetical protein